MKTKNIIVFLIIHIFLLGLSFSQTAEEYYKIAQEELNKKNYQSAILNFSNAIRVNPNYAEAYFYRGYVKSMIGDNGETIEDYNKAIELNPKYVNAYYYRGVAKSKLKEYSGAIHDYSKTIELYPNYTKVYLLRGCAKFELGDYIGAIQDLSIVIGINPCDTFTYINRGYAKSKLGDYIGAIEDYSKVIELNPNDMNAYVNRGLNKIHLGNKNGGCLDFSKAGELGFKQAHNLIKEYCNNISLLETSQQYLLQNKNLNDIILNTKNFDSEPDISGTWLSNFKLTSKKDYVSFKIYNNNGNINGSTGTDSITGLYDYPDVYLEFCTLSLDKYIFEGIMSKSGKLIKGTITSKKKVYGTSKFQTISEKVFLKKDF
jgi:tetratricopeptide (TPR) repeat protein